MKKLKSPISFIFLIGFLEFAAAAFVTLQIDTDPKNAQIFGYSFQRIALFALTLLPGLVLLYLARQAWQDKINRKALSFLDNPPPLIQIIFLASGLLAACLYLTPIPWFGALSGYFHHLQLFLVVFISFPFQLLLFKLVQTRRHLEHTGLKTILIFSGIMAAFWLIAIFTGWGITPELKAGSHQTWYNIAGSPITLLEWFAVLLAALLISTGIYLALKYTHGQTWWLDAILIVGLTIITALVWVWTPTKASSFIKIASPFFQPFPLSDASVHDLGGISILLGHGINFGAYTDKPLYMVFLAILHFFSGYNYSLLVKLQIVCMACMVPVLYWLGKSFHSRSLGILGALLLITHQSNAIQLTNNLFYNAAPNLLLTEVPTLFTIILLTWACFEWMKNPRAIAALAAGGILGISALLRLNSVLLLPFIPFFTFWVTRNKKAWLGHCLLYSLAFVLLISPWLLTGQDAAGRPYMMIKFFDILNVRYGATTPEMNPDIQPGDIIKPIHPLQADQPLGTHPPRPFSLLEVNRFPGFIFNNVLHNVVESILELPDSLNPEDQILVNLNSNFYWKPENFNLYRIPFILLNSFLVALGLAWSWKRWKLPGLLPTLILLVYALSLALARTSGSRYLVPIDWLIYFYYTVGVLTFLEFFLPALFRLSNSNLPEALIPDQTRPAFPFYQSPKFWAIGSAFIILATFIPIANRMIPQDQAFCSQNDLPLLVKQQTGFESTTKMDFMKGLVLYPTTENKILTFELLSCQKIYTFEFKIPSQMIASGETVIVGWEDDGSNSSVPNKPSVLIPLPKK